MSGGDDFYIRYYVGHKGKFGHEFLEFEFRPDGKVIRGQGWREEGCRRGRRPARACGCRRGHAGRHPPAPPAAAADPPLLLSSLQLRYANNSNYKNDTMIRKEAFVSQAVLDELKRIIEDSEVRGQCQRQWQWRRVAGGGCCRAAVRVRWAESSLVGTVSLRCTETPGSTFKPIGQQPASPSSPRWFSAAAPSPLLPLQLPLVHTPHQPCPPSIHWLPLPALPPSVLQVMKEDDANWPEPDRVGRQELEIVMGNEHVSFATTKLGSLLQVWWPGVPMCRAVLGLAVACCWAALPLLDVLRLLLRCPCPRPWPLPTFVHPATAPSASLPCAGAKQQGPGGAARLLLPGAGGCWGGGAL